MNNPDFYAYQDIKSNRYWKNEAYLHPDKYIDADIAFMVKGLAPTYPGTNIPMELHHINGRDIADPHNYDNLLPVWPWKHAAIDPYRYYTGWRPDSY